MITWYFQLRTDSPKTKPFFFRTKPGSVLHDFRNYQILHFRWKQRMQRSCWLIGVGIFMSSKNSRRKWEWIAEYILQRSTNLRDTELTLDFVFKDRQVYKAINFKRFPNYRQKLHPKGVVNILCNTTTRCPILSSPSVLYSSFSRSFYYLVDLPFSIIFFLSLLPVLFLSLLFHNLFFFII